MTLCLLDDSSARLPSASTCALQLNLPQSYESPDVAPGARRVMVGVTGWPTSPVLPRPL